MSLGRSVLLSSAIAAALAYSCSSTDIGTGGVGGGFGGATIGTGVSGAATPMVATSSGAGGAPDADDLACKVSKTVASGTCVTVTPGAGGGGFGGAGGGAVATIAASSSSTGSGPGTGGGGGGSSCNHVFNPSACADCVVQNCCAETVACEQVDGCIACFTQDMSASGCNDAPIHEPLRALNHCEKTSCGSACGVAIVYHCNPVTNYPCNTDAGEACDLSGEGTFECFPPPNTQKLCESCSVTNMRPYCEPGLHCVEEDVASPTGFCGRYCCFDDDCCPDGTSSCGNKCDYEKLLGVKTPVGICTSH